MFKVTELKKITELLPLKKIQSLFIKEISRMSCVDNEIDSMREKQNENVK